MPRSRKPVPRTHGALALQEPMHPAPRREERPVRREQEQDFREITRRHDERKRQPKGSAQPRRGFRLRPKYVFLTLLVFGAVFGLLYRQTLIEQKMLELHDMRTLLTNEQKRGEDLNLELSMKLDIEQVQSVARQQLGMDYPDAGQTRAVLLPPMTNQSTAQYVEAPISIDTQPDSFSAWLDQLREQLSR